jgi:hypothetical protein
MLDHYVYTAIFALAAVHSLLVEAILHFNHVRTTSTTTMNQLFQTYPLSIYTIEQCIMLFESTSAIAAFVVYIRPKTHTMCHQSTCRALARRSFVLLGILRIGLSYPLMDTPWCGDCTTREFLSETPETGLFCPLCKSPVLPLCCGCGEGVAQDAEIL